MAEADKAQENISESNPPLENPPKDKGNDKGDDTKTTSLPEGFDVKALMKTPEFKQEIKGLMDNKDQIIKEKRELEAKFRQLETVINELGGTEGVKTLKKFQDQLQQDEDAKILAAGDVDGYNRRITERARQEMQGLVDQAEGKNQKLQSQVEAQQGMINELVIDAQVDAVLGKLPDVIPSAISKIKRDVREKFKINPESGRPEAKDSKNQLEYGGNGEPLSIEEWMRTTLVEESPFYFRGKSGGSIGADQGNGADGTIHITREQAKDFNYYQKMRKLAIERGEEWPPKTGFDRSR